MDQGCPTQASDCHRPAGISSDGSPAGLGWTLPYEHPMESLWPRISCCYKYILFTLDIHLRCWTSMSSLHVYCLVNAIHFTLHFLSLTFLLFASVASIFKCFVLMAAVHIYQLKSQYFIAQSHGVMWWGQGTDSG